MYNEELKTKFVTEQSKNIKQRQTYISFFNSIEKMEMDVGRDICAFDAEELQITINKLCGVRSRSIVSKLAMLKNYARWCVDNGVDGASLVIFEIKPDNTEKFRSQMVGDPEQLQEYMDVVFNKEEDNTVDNTYRAFFWLAYAGFFEEDIISIRCDEVPMRGQLRIRGINIEKLGWYSIRHCAVATEFSYSHPIYGNAEPRERIYGDNLIRGIRRNPSVVDMRAMISRKAKKAKQDGSTDRQLSYYRVFLSGLFYSKYKEECITGIPASFRDVAYSFIDGKEYKLEKSRSTMNGKINEVENEYQRDYELWKEIFH